MQWLILFLIGGAVVSLFATAGHILRPKGFAGLFSAAPSVARAARCRALKMPPSQYPSRFVGHSTQNSGCLWLQVRARKRAAGGINALVQCVWFAAGPR